MEKGFTPGEIKRSDAKMIGFLKNPSDVFKREGGSPFG
jgi:hypothetical protein